MRTKQAPNQTDIRGGDFTLPQRFPSILGLMTNYDHCKTIRKDKSWENLVKQYKRIPYRDGNTSRPNFGSLRGKIDKELTAYVDFATERERWVKAKTDVGFNEGSSNLYVQHIEAGLQRFLFDRWDKSFTEIMMACYDMLMFSKGCFTWFDDDCPYPTNTDITHVWPNARASMDVDKWSICHVHRRISAIDLYRKLKCADADDGWNTQAVESMLKFIGGWTDSNLDSLAMSVEGKGGSSEFAETEIDLIYSFVKEYHMKPESDDEAEVGEGKGEPREQNGISVYVFPATKFFPRKDASGNPDKADIKRLGYLLYKPYVCKRMSEKIQIVAPTVFRDYYDDPSKAEQLYMMTKTYDLVMARILEGVEDNMRVYLKSTSSEAFRKLQSMRHGNKQVLDPTIEIVQQRVVIPVQEAMSALRMLIIDQAANQGEYLTGGTDEKSQPKTARQSGIDFNESRAVGTSSLKVFNAHFTGIVRQMVRMFLNKENVEPESDHEKNLNKFISYLQHHKVPLECLDEDNLFVESTFNADAGSPTAQLQSASVVMDALSRNVSSPGERQAQRDMIAAAKGVSSVSAYLPDDIDTPIPEDSRIGLENDALSAAHANPNNVVVLKTDLHMRHLASHVSDSEVSMKAALSLFQNLQSMGEAVKAPLLFSIQDILIGIDNKLAHSQAHIQFALKDANKNKKAQLDAIAARIGILNRQQDELENNLTKLIQALNDQAQPSSGNDLEFEHKKRMFDLEASHAAQMLAFDAEKQRSKAEQLALQSADRAALEAQIKQRQADLDNFIKVTTAQANMTVNSIKSTGRQARSKK